MKTKLFLWAVAAGLALLGTGCVGGQKATVGGGKNATGGATVSPPWPAAYLSLAEPVTVSVEGKSLMTGDPIAGHWTGYGPAFKMAMEPEKHPNMHARLAGRIAQENGAYRVSYMFQEREDSPSQPMSGGKPGSLGVATFINEVLLKMDEPVTVLDGKDGTLVLKVTKAVGQPEPKPKIIAMDIILVGDAFKENMTLTVRGEYVKGEPFERTMTAARGNWELTMAKGAPDGVTMIVARLSSAGENRYRINSEVYGGAPGAPIDWAGDASHNGGSAPIYLRVGEPVLVPDGKGGNTTFVLTPASPGDGEPVKVGK